MKNIIHVIILGGDIMQFIDSILNYYNEQLTNFEKLEAAFSDDQKEKWAELEVQLNEVYDSGVVS